MDAFSSQTRRLQENCNKLLLRFEASEEKEVDSGSKSDSNAIEGEVDSWSSNSKSGSEDDNGGKGDNFVVGGRAERIKEKLERELSPIELEVDDVSYEHAGHVGNISGENGTHINLKIVSKEFEGKSVVKRHRIIYGLLQDELQSRLHALSIVAKAPRESNL